MRYAPCVQRWIGQLVGAGDALRALRAPRGSARRRYSLLTSILGLATIGDEHIAYGFRSSRRQRSIVGEALSHEALFVKLFGLALRAHIGLNAVPHGR